MGHGPALLSTEANGGFGIERRPRSRVSSLRFSPLAGAKSPLRLTKTSTVDPPLRRTPQKPGRRFQRYSRFARLRHPSPSRPGTASVSTRDAGFRKGRNGSSGVSPAPHPSSQISTVSSTEVLAGLVDRVTFHNVENGFCVLRVKARGQRDLITLVGHAAMISAGEFVQASGSWINDRTHGVKFKASFLKATAPTTVEGIEKYLGSGMIRGIGPVYAKKLVRAFGETVFDIIEQEPGRLREV